MASHSILVVDDEVGIRQSLEEILREEGWQTESVATGEECLQALKKKTYDLILLDVWLPGQDGLAVLKQIKQDSNPAPAVIMISGHGNIETAVKATKLGAFDFLEKPLSLDRTVLLIQHALDQLRLATENRRLREQLQKRYQIVGESIPVKALRQQLSLTAPTNGRVLIYGESGTGKELVARALHLQSLRAEAPLVEVNCAAIPEELIESELFGHKKGSFTGASEDKTGKFLQADGGTLFLDEVGDMSLRTQSKVLRALEEQRIEPVGAGKSVEVDTRVIAATNKNLEEEIAEGRFREDLFYRLNVIPFHVPALRERAEDIPLLADYFLEEFADAYGRRKKTLTPETLTALCGYGWPGNVRELRNLLERLVIMVPAESIEPQHLPPELFRPGGRPPADAATLEEARTGSERELILRKLKENQWIITRTADAIGVDRSHLHRKMRSLGISAKEKG
jgi:two-component system nitrogen regulation response regulator NtrX